MAHTTDQHTLISRAFIVQLRTDADIPAGRRLASFSRLILFDKRGTGLSDRVGALPTLEERMDDVRAVMDAAGSERAALLGISEGGPMCSLFAATYPEKTIALVMIGTYAKRIWDPEYPWAPTIEARERFFDEIRDRWGGPVGLDVRAPSVARTRHSARGGALTCAWAPVRAPRCVSPR